MAATGYFELGELARDDGGIVCALCEGGVGCNTFNFNVLTTTLGQTWC